MKYSVICPVFLINPCIRSTSCGESRAKRNLRSGTINRDVFSEEPIPVDMTKMIPIQKITGSQYLMIFRVSYLFIFF